jgi:hypothetical protein
MVINKKLFEAVWLFLLILSGCVADNYSNPNKVLKHTKKTFGVETNISGLMAHFPEKIKNRNIFFEVNPPYCPPPPTYKCSAQFGDVYLNVSKTDYKKDFKKILNGNILYTTNYFDNNNIIINLTELRRNIFPIKKCNKYFPDKFPIPYFESYDFGLGVQKEKKKVDGKVYYNYIHTIPEDLKVYIIEARAGNFWKFDCKENRPETLGKWKHGYSKGVAVSDKYDRVAFWVIVW